MTRLWLVFSVCELLCAEARSALSSTGIKSDSPPILLQDKVSLFSHIAESSLWATSFFSVSGAGTVAAGLVNLPSPFKNKMSSAQLLEVELSFLVNILSFIFLSSSDSI